MGIQYGVSLWRRIEDWGCWEQYIDKLHLQGRNCYVKGENHMQNFIISTLHIFIKKRKDKMYEMNSTCSTKLEMNDRYKMLMEYVY